jgi:hypothetical protein
MPSKGIIGITRGAPKKVSKSYKKDKDPLRSKYYKRLHDQTRGKKFSTWTKEEKLNYIAEKMATYDKGEIDFTPSKRGVNHTSQPSQKGIRKLSVDRPVIGGLSYNQVMKMLDKMCDGDKKDEVISKYLETVGLI